MSYYLPMKRMQNMTIIGAITSNKNKMYYRICDKTNLYNVDKFFRKLHREINL